MEEEAALHDAQNLTASEQINLFKAIAGGGDDEEVVTALRNLDDEGPDVPSINGTGSTAFCEEKGATNPSQVQNKKRGIKRGSKCVHKKTQEDWFIACQSFRELNREHRAISQAEFLRSNLSTAKFNGNKCEQTRFSAKLKQYDSGNLRSTKDLRDRKSKYGEIEKRLVEYVKTESKDIVSTLTWLHVKEKCKEWGKELGHQDFRASDGWIDKVMKNNKLTLNSRSKRAEDSSNSCAIIGNGNLLTTHVNTPYITEV